MSFITTTTMSFITTTTMSFITTTRLMTMVSTAMNLFSTMKDLRSIIMGYFWMKHLGFGSSATMTFAYGRPTTIRLRMK